MCRIVIFPKYWGKGPEWKQPAAGPRMMPNEERSGYNHSPPQVLLPCPSQSSTVPKNPPPPHLHLLIILQCPLDAFPPLVLIYSFNILPKQNSFLFVTTQSLQKNSSPKQVRHSDILHPVSPYNPISPTPSLLKV